MSCIDAGGAATLSHDGTPGCLFNDGSKTRGTGLLLQKMAGTRKKTVLICAATGMSHDNLDYEAILRRAGHRVTRQRLHILDAVCEGRGHTTLKQIYTRVRAADNTIDRSSLYRALKLFAELGLVVVAVTPDGETYYEIPKAHAHHHLLCRMCGTEIEIGPAAAEHMFEEIRRVHDFKVEMDHLVLHGVCSRCGAAV
jgi:Fur family transcriptional regulator, ferric uptake regulator